MWDVRDGAAGSALLAKNMLQFSVKTTLPLNTFCYYICVVAHLIELMPSIQPFR